MPPIYVYHRVTTEPRQWRHVADELGAVGAPRLAAAGGGLYGIWRSQIGRPRDELTVMTVWPEPDTAASATEVLLQDTRSVRHCDSERLTPTLRPTAAEPPRRQGSYAFRCFETPAAHWQEFLDLCAAAWPGFEAAYDSQIIGLWRSLEDAGPLRRSLLLTRRPNLAMWERSKMPEGAAEDQDDLVRWT